MVSLQATRFPKRWLRHLLHPTWLAGIISVGVHGGLFAAGPTFEGLNFKAIAELDLPEEQRQVPLVELTAAEQARLPDFSQPFYSLENFGELEPLNPLVFGEGAGNPEIGKTSPSPFRGSNNRSGITSPSDEPSSGSRTPDYTIVNPNGPPPDLSIFSSPNDSILSSGEEADTLEETSEETEGDTPAAENSDSEDTSNNANEPSAEDLQTETASSETPEPSAPNIAEFFAQGNSIEDLTEETQFEIFTTYNDASTTDEDERYEDWILRSKRAYDNPQLEFFESEPLLLQPPEPQYCLQPEPQNGLVGALVDPEGNLLGQPEILGSTGYLGFNLQAAQIVRAQPFEPTKSVAAYRFPVIVEYDAENCVAVPEIKDSPAKENTATPENSEVDSPDQSNAESSPDAAAEQEPGAGTGRDET